MAWLSALPFSCLFSLSITEELARKLSKSMTLARCSHSSLNAHRWHAHGLPELKLLLRNPGSVQGDEVALALTTLGFKRETKFPETSSGPSCFDSGSQHKVADSRLSLLVFRHRLVLEQPSDAVVLSAPTALAPPSESCFLHGV